MRFIRVQTSGVAKRYTFKSNDGHIVKAAYVKRSEKDIICLSTQIGCVGQCKFCSAYGKPLLRGLRTEEMDDMVNQIYNRSGMGYPRPFLVSFMGTGEPLANLDNILREIQNVIVDCKFALSVSGHRILQIELIPVRVKVQFTLVSANPYIRDFLQPNVDSLSDLRYAAEHYSGPKEFSIPLIAGYNDDPAAIRQIADFVKASGNIPIKLNRYHPVNGFKSSERAYFCLGELEGYGCKVEYYETDGADIYAACGQFEIGE